MRSWAGVRGDEWGREEEDEQEKEGNGRTCGGGWEDLRMKMIQFISVVCAWTGRRAEGVRISHTDMPHRFSTCP